MLIFHLTSYLLILAQTKQQIIKFREHDNNIFQWLTPNLYCLKDLMTHVGGVISVILEVATNRVAPVLSNSHPKNT